MQGIQKAKCASCGVMFISENESKTCPSCANHDSNGMMDGCGCGHHH